MTWDKVTNRRIELLHPKIKQDAEDFINEVEERGIKLRITQGLRTIKEQNAIFNQPFDGIDNDKDGKIDEKDEKVSNAKGGKSFHNYGLAIDVCEIKDGKANFNPDWKIIVPIAEKYGFFWGGNFKSIIDKPHFEKTFGKYTSELFKQGKTYPEV